MYDLINEHRIALEVAGRDEKDIQKFVAEAVKLPSIDAVYSLIAGFDVVRKA